MSRMAESLWNLIESNCEPEKLVDMYWILSGFLDQVQKFQKDIACLQECTCKLLEREDTELYKHLVKIDALKNLPFDSWFSSCFAGTISDGSLPKYVFYCLF